ncbi:hypothetical protein NDU88_008015 [Pleurodeles waltl]|uniref:Uncharacterized protein n=1 Tax=Pleurodeles waltl TaxID=8319 RepID=A0AAV7PRX8_PLEWA|nr:hypothetical protein NDU88_008015 [Pleurodeles waltl]
MENQGTTQEFNLEEIIKTARKAASTRSKEWILRQIRRGGASERPTQEVHTQDLPSDTARDETALAGEAEKRQRNASTGDKKGDKKESI